MQKPFDKYKKVKKLNSNLHASVYLVRHLPSNQDVP